MNSIIDLEKYICDTLHEYKNIVVDAKGNGVVDYLGHSIKFNVFQWDGEIFIIDFDLGINIIDEYAQFYNILSGITRLIGSSSLRLSYCVADQLPSTDFILNLFDDVLEAWLILRFGFGQIQQEMDGLDSDSVSDDFDPESYYDQLIGDKLFGLTL